MPFFYFSKSAAQAAHQQVIYQQNSWYMPHQSILGLIDTQFLRIHIKQQPF
jgi:hypothetical protein